MITRLPRLLLHAMLFLSGLVCTYIATFNLDRYGLDRYDTAFFGVLAVVFFGLALVSWD